jgi:hypothetical protein
MTTTTVPVRDRELMRAAELVGLVFGYVPPDSWWLWDDGDTVEFDDGTVIVLSDFE